MTRTDNNTILEQHRDEIERIGRERGLQAAVNYANTLIDVSQGIVGGDGSYWPRRDRFGRDPFNF